MILDIIGDIPAKEGLILKVNGIEKELNSVSKKMRFQIPDEKECMVYFKQKKRPKRNPVLSFLLFLLTSIFQGFANILALNESVAWFRNLQPYLIKGHFSLPCKEHTIIALKYLPSQYLEDMQTWSKPQLIIFESDQNPAQPKWETLKVENFMIRHEKDLNQFHSRFGSYVRRVLSTSLIWLILFSILLAAARLKEIPVGETVLSVLLIGILCVSAFLLITQYIKKIKLLSKFKKSEE
ncbi:MAG: hypothetical protein IKW18_01375 [Clostridia bacterium]|nr:hypothetical protein [Clostridia bacterium]